MWVCRTVIALSACWQKSPCRHKSDTLPRTFAASEDRQVVTRGAALGSATRSVCPVTGALDLFQGGGEAGFRSRISSRSRMADWRCVSSRDCRESPLDAMEPVPRREGVDALTGLAPVLPHGAGHEAQKETGSGATTHRVDRSATLSRRDRTWDSSNTD